MISDAGMPGISDPGTELVSHVNLFKSLLWDTLKHFTGWHDVDTCIKHEPAFKWNSVDVLNHAVLPIYLVSGFVM